MNSGFDYYKDRIFSEAIETSSELNTQIIKEDYIPMDRYIKQLPI